MGLYHSLLGLFDLFTLRPNIKGLYTGMRITWDTDLTLSCFLGWLDGGNSYTERPVPRRESQLSHGRHRCGRPWHCLWWRFSEWKLQWNHRIGGKNQIQKESQPQNNNNNLTNEGIGTRQGNNLGYVTEEMPDEIWPTVVEIKARDCLN